MEFDLYFDESGQFEEVSLVAETVVRRGVHQRWPSQLVGIVAPATQVAVHASTVMHDAYKSAGVELLEVAHANELIRQDRNGYQEILQAIAEGLRRKDWQPVRLANSARLGYGDKTATYTNLVAELVIRIFELLSRRHPGIVIELNIIYASVFLGESSDGSPTFIEKADYGKRLSEYLTFAAVRRGVALNSGLWRVKKIEYASGLRNRGLQICDHLSHASHDNFKNCSSGTKAILQDVLANYDFNLMTPDALKAIQNQLEDGAVVLALQICIETLRQKDLAPWVRSQLAEYCAQIMDRIACQAPAIRDANLRQLVDWVRQIVLARNLPVAAETIGWLQKNLVAPLRNSTERNVAGFSWFELAILVQALAVNNHAGRLRDARECIKSIKALVPEIAGHWEHAPLMMEAFILEAVHLNDAFAPAEAAKVMKTVADYYDSLAGLMNDALPGAFPGKVHSYDRGRALGTLVQAEMYAALAEPVRFEIGRNASEEAIREFTEQDDIAQQHQYRAQLETYAGMLPVARKFLALSLGARDAGHEALAAAIEALPEPAAGFPLLHWSRIGLEAARLHDLEECAAFSAALRGSQLSSSAWMQDLTSFYPAHGIRRHLAAFYAAIGEGDFSLSVLGRLLSLPSNQHEILTVIQIAGALEVVARLGDKKRDVVRKLINSDDPKKPGIVRLCVALSKRAQGFAEIQDLLKNFEAAVARFEKSSYTEGDEILALVRLVGQ